MAAVDLISYTVVDVAGTRSQVHLYAPSGSTVAQLQALSDEVVAALDEIIAGQVISANLNLALTLPGTLKLTPLAGHYVQMGANFGFNALGTAYRHSIRVPSILESLVVGDEVDLTDADVTAFVDAIVDPAATTKPSDRHGADLTGVINAPVTFRSG